MKIEKASNRDNKITKRRSTHKEITQRSGDIEKDKKRAEEWRKRREEKEANLENV